MANSPISFTHNGLFSIERGASRHQLTLLDLFGTNDLDSPEGRYFTLSYQLVGITFEIDGKTLTDEVRFTINDVREGKLYVSSNDSEAIEGGSFTIVSGDDDNETSAPSIASQVEITVTQPEEAPLTPVVPQAPLAEITAASAQQEVQTHSEDAPEGGANASASSSACASASAEAAPSSQTEPSTTSETQAPANAATQEDNLGGAAGQNSSVSSLFSYNAGDPIDASAETGDLFIIGTDRADSITAGQGDDAIEGGGGNDRIYLDDDDSTTQTGADTLYYSFESVTEGYRGLDGRDYIKEFKIGEDKLILRGEGLSFDTNGDFLAALKENGVTASSIISKTSADKSRGVLIDFAVADASETGASYKGRIVILFEDEIEDSDFAIDDNANLGAAKRGLKKITDLTVLETVLGEDGISYGERVITNGASGGEVLGSDLSDIIKPGSGNDTVKAGGGDDIIYASGGSDRYEGGAGYDIVSYELILVSLTLDMNADPTSAVADLNDSFFDIEAIIGSAFNDVIVGHTQLALRLFGGDGNDKITAGGLASRLFGDDGDDELIGGAGDDVLYGGAGDDRLVDGGGINNAFHGGAGTDTVDYSQASERVGLSLRAGDIVASQCAATSDSYSGIENIIGSDYDDRIHGDDGNNYIQGGAGDDVFRGYGGDDLFEGGVGADIMNGYSGSDTVTYVNSNAAVRASLQDNSGSAGSQASGGHAQGDRFYSIENLIGSDFADTITGNSVANRLAGGKGSDTLTGLGGDDIFDFSDIVAGNNDITTITDFSQSGADGNDVIDLSAFLQSDDVTKITGEVKSISSQSLLELSYVTTAADGTEVSVIFARLNDITTIDETDFMGDSIPTIEVI